MIPSNSITAWGVQRLWPNRAAIEQDLLLARLTADIYNHPMLRDELAVRGGTCLHQVHLPAPLRYSEDLDFVRRTHTGIGGVFDALRDVATAAGLNVHGTDIGQHPKMRLRAPAEDGLILRIKLEINTHETSPAYALERIPFDVSNPWFTGKAEVLTFAAAELVATKLRALFQRSKGRDLFDLWLALTQMRIEPDDILTGFAPYRATRVHLRSSDREPARQGRRPDLPHGSGPPGDRLARGLRSRRRIRTGHRRVAESRVNVGPSPDLCRRRLAATEPAQGFVVRTLDRRGCRQTRQR